MKERMFLLLACLMISIGYATAQTTKVSGVVIDEIGDPVIGASVLVKNTTLGTITNIDGEFTISNIPSNAKLLKVSYIGMKSVETAIKSQLKIVLKADAEQLDEVVVTGYGNYKKSSFTGAASNISTEKLQDIPSVSIQDKLAGSVAGVQMNSVSGQPGASESIRIRGMGSINANNNPLYVIDGIPVISEDVSEFSYSGSGTSILSTINSNDIESMTVIKDAAAASLYGSRAANGVIIITTKKGSSGKMKMNFRSDWGFSDKAINYRPTLNGDERREILHLGLKNYALNGGDDEATATAFADKYINNYAAKPWSGYTDWEDILYRNGSHQNYELNAQGGNEKTKFYTSLSYTKQDGITLNSGLERTTGRANISHTANRITLEASTMFTNSVQNVTSEGTSFSSPIMCVAMTASPSTYPYNEDGTFSTSFPALNGANPLKTATYNYDRNNVIRSLNSISAKWNIWDNLNIKESLGYDFNQVNSRVWWDPRSHDGRSSKGVYQRVMTNRTKLNTQTQLTYNKTIAESHNIDALLGFETEDYKYDYTYTNGSNYPSYLPEIENAGNSRGSSGYSAYRLISYLGRLNYDYKGKYYLSASFRRDGSSRLSSESRWGDFWSVSGSWRLSHEKFMESTADVITDAKIRASYGINGTQPNDYYGYKGLYEFGYNYNGLSGSSESRIFNPSLKWEKNYATNIGLDLSLFNRVSITAEWYNRDTKDLLMDKPISAVIGVGDSNGNATTLVNIGSMRNRGFEFEVKTTNLQTKDILWTSSFNIGHNKNELTKLDGYQTEIIDGQLIHKIGKSYNSFYAYEYAGVDPKTGKELYFINGEDDSRETTTKSSEANKKIIGSADPKVQGGLTNFFSWKFIDVNLTLTYSLGGHAMDNASWLQTNGGSLNYSGNVPSYYKIEDTWQKEGDIAKLPQFAYGNKTVTSSRWMMSTDHLRLKNMSVGFTMPSHLTSKAGINKLRAYVSGSNLLTWKKESLYVDPETPSNGICTFQTPSLRTVTFGLEVSF